MPSHFEKLVDDEMAKVAQASLQVELGDSHKSAFIKGRYAGMQEALTLYRTSIRKDLDPDGDKF